MTVSAVELAEITGLALVIALSPVPVTGQLLLVLTNASRLTATAFVSGWAAAIAAVCGLVATGTAILLPPAPVEWADIALVPLIVGCGLVAAGIVMWRRTQPDPNSEPSRIAATFTRLTPVRALFLGLAYGGVRPKNFVPGVAAGLIIGASADAWTGTILVAYFAVIGSATLAAPVLVHTLGGARVRSGMRRLQQTLSQHGKRITGSALLGVGILLAAFGLYQLLQ